MKNRIRLLRAERQWSQAELAERVRVSRNSINSGEKGKFDPSLPLAFRIADASGHVSWRGTPPMHAFERDRAYRTGGSLKICAATGYEPPTTCQVAPARWNPPG